MNYEIKMDNVLAFFSSCPLVKSFNFPFQQHLFSEDVFTDMSPESLITTSISIA